MALEAKSVAEGLASGAGTQAPSGSRKFLTTHWKRNHPLWAARTEMLPGWQEEVMRHWPRQVGHLRSLVWAWRLFRASRRYDAVITGSEHVGHLFALLQGVLRRRNRRVVHVLVDFPWAATPKPLLAALKRLQMRIEGPAISRILAHGGPGEIERFADMLGLSPEKFAFVPYHHTLHGMKFEVTNGGYVFAGGDPTRDYASLIRAATGMPWPVVICARGRHHFEGLTIPPNVEIKTTTDEEFCRLMAGAAVVVLPILGGSVHTGGHTILANAMTMGKPVIVAANWEDYRHYVDHGKSGLLVSPSDPEVLRQAINSVLSDSSYAGKLGAGARADAKACAPEAFLERVFALIEEAKAEIRMGKEDPWEPAGRAVSRDRR